MKCLKECHSEGPRRAPTGPRKVPHTGPHRELLHGGFWGFHGGPYGGHLNSFPHVGLMGAQDGLEEEPLGSLEHEGVLCCSTSLIVLAGA
eukprot:1140441-Pelagomonas_calceolata.AAC.1